MKKTKIIFLLIMLSFQVGSAIAQDAAEPKTTGPGDTYVMIVGGINKDPEERQAKDKAVISLRKFLLEEAQIDPKRMRVLVDENSFARKDTGVSTYENLQKVIAEMAGAVKPGDRFIFYYVGQANIVASKLRFNLPGDDMTHQELTEQLKKIKPVQMLIVLDCPGAGLAVKAMTGPGRIVVCGARSDQPYSPRFSQYFIPALIDSTVDTDEDGRISLLEAFTSTAMQLDDLYREQDLMRTETPLLEDDGDGIPSQQPWRYVLEENDGLIASKFFLTETEKLTSDAK